MVSSRSSELASAIDLAWRMGGVMRDYFTRAELAQKFKADGSIVTEADQAISQLVVQAYAARGRAVVSEEGGSAPHGTPDAEYLDPIDGTSDFEQGRRRQPPQSVASMALGSVQQSRFVRGVVNFPLLLQPRLYWAEAGRGAHYLLEPAGRPVPVRVATQQRGIVLVTAGGRPLSILPRLAELGFTPLPYKGAIFKGCCVADPSLIAVGHQEVPLDQPVVGFLSESAWPHDYAASAVMVREAGGFACGLDGGELLLTGGKNGCIFANTADNQDLFLNLMASRSA